MKKISLKQLYEINNRYPDKKNIHQMYNYDVKKNEWVFRGYICSKCQRQFKKLGVIDEHELKCRMESRYKNNQSIEHKIIDVNRNIWAPLDINQNREIEN